LKRDRNRRAAILQAARRISAEGGPRRLTYEAIARRLGVTKQAIIYWFPTKQDLHRELVVPWLEAEADAVIDALAAPRGAGESIGRAVHALVDFHTDDLDRFRQMYFGIQLDPKPEQLMTPEALRTHVHPVTSRLYGVLESALEADSRLQAGRSPRQAAVIVHTSALGLVMMVALASALKDPLKHATHELVGTLVAMLTGGAGDG
jgi:AcrR family transcriptional regulator